VDALLLSQSANVAWLTNGARTYVNMATEGSFVRPSVRPSAAGPHINDLPSSPSPPCAGGVGSIYVDAASVRILTNEIEGHRLLNEELNGLQDAVTSVEQDPWHAQRPHAAVAAGLAAQATGKPQPDVVVAVDAAHAALAARLGRLRVTLSAYEMDCFRSLGVDCGELIGEVARSVTPGVTEWEVASALAAKLLAREITPVVLLVAADERVDAIRHPLPTRKRVKHKLMLVLCGRRHGLVCSVTRLVYITTSPGAEVPADLLRRHDAATYVDAVAIAESGKPGTSAAEVLAAMQRAYAAKGFDGEWQFHHQGGCAAFVSREWVANPAVTDRGVQKNQAYAWNPSVAGTKSEDTILVTDGPGGEAVVEVLTPTKGWPAIEHEVDGQTISRPAILHLAF
jgi:Xaa-Pro aminopeptidase